MNKRKHSIKYTLFCTIFLAASLTCSLILTGSFFNPAPAVTMDTGTHHIYQHINVDKILMDFQADKASAKDLYADKYYAIYGKATAKSNGKVTLNGIDHIFENALSCRAEDEELYEKIGKLKENDLVKIYGRITVNFFNGEPSILADDIQKTNTASVSLTAYTATDGTTYDQKDMAERSLADGAMTFSIPSSWTGVEHNLKKEGLGTIEGFQYRLNETEKKAAYAESLFICSLNKNELVSVNDLEKPREIEAAIAEDILGRELKNRYPLTTVKTYYGKTYRYYQDIFETSGGDRLNTEFIFEESDENRLNIYLYIYREARHLDEIMLVLRLVN